MSGFLEDQFSADISPKVNSSAVRWQNALSHVLEIVEESDSSYKTYLSAYVSDKQSLIVNKVTNIAIIFCHATIL